MRRLFLGTFLLSFAFITELALAENVRGEYEGVGFTAQLSHDNRNVTVTWDDGATSVRLPYTATPTRPPRCPCNVYESYPRQVIIHLAEGRATHAEYVRLDRRSVVNTSIPVPENATCTRDINRWGHPSACTCPFKYTYNRRTGQCDYNPTQVSQLRGKHNLNGVDYGYTVDISARGDKAMLRWDDGSTGFTAVYNPRPVPAPRCNCWVYDGPKGRTITVELEENNILSRVEYSRN